MTVLYQNGHTHEEEVAPGQSLSHRAILHAYCNHVIYEGTRLRENDGEGFGFCFFVARLQMPDSFGGWRTSLLHD